MAVSFDFPLARSTSRLILGVTAATCLVAAVAAAPSTPAKDAALAASVRAAVSVNESAVRPLAKGPAIQIGRAYGAEDEDCTLVMTPTTDAHGRTRYSRSVTCAN